MNKKGPLLLLLFLFLILVFVVGIRYGQKVEETNKVIKYLISLPPSPTPSKPKPVEYKTYEGKTCNLQFLYPNTLTVQDSTDEATFKENGKEKIVFDCTTISPLQTLLKDPKVATAEITFQNRKMQVKTKNDRYLFQFADSLNGKLIYFSVDKTLYPLFESTFELVR